ncbi:histidine--tRNA ligase [Flavobacterium cyanobacteriorum]|uniref:Histidine--tRNA ligase n=1 Tax=Flavobacterium cyanobacteriorum TaxID=2022802 RepID=A0A255Z866_9FLAO|nr:histidine--tRNA ligase [Flavobacterium cyanobacteriorum]OYQ37753.1 histidine--tRNA ligase [Flavobacterium cyanobacteriorum]
MAQKPGIPKGTRDFSPAEVAKRQYIIAVIKHHFETFGYQPIETPSFENSETLMGKYGEEGDRLIFKILNSGDYFLSTSKSIEDFAVIVSDLQIIRDNAKNGSIINFSKQSEIIDIKERLHIGDKLKNIYISLLNEDTFWNNIIESDSVEDIIKSGFLDIVFAEFSSIKLTPQISEKALRYDLTVPFARYVVMHQNEIEFPFKRYQIQPVWRADRPQKGRFREFYQCDADVVGSASLWQEVELVQLYDNVFTALGLGGAAIKINNRKVLSGIAEVIGAKDKLIDFTVALDKLDKIGEEGVKKEMLEKGITQEAIEKVQPLFNFTGSVDEKLARLSDLLATSEEGMKGVEELRFICANVTQLGLKKSVLDLDVTLARGLNYYTGAIFEVTAPKGVVMGSIGGGGRYDDLTGIFGLKNMSGVGISFGLDRIYLVLEELGLFPGTITETTKALFLNFGNREALYAMKAIGKLRERGIKAELYPDAAKIARQFQYADKRGIPFAVLAGDAEMSSNTFTLKNLVTGSQQQVAPEQLMQALQ